MKKQTEDEGWETNRYKKLRITKKSKFWCGYCDRELVGKGEKCCFCKSHKKPHRAIGGEKRKLKHY